MSDLMSEQINELALALSKAQSAIENVNKDKQAYGYKYADLASCLDAIKIPLSENGLSITQLISQEGERHVLVTMLLHSSGQWLKSTFSIEGVVMKSCNSLQQLGAGVTYARRYALSAIIGLTQEDNDAQSLPKKHYDHVEHKEPVHREQTPAQILLQMCRQHDLDATAFTKFHDIHSSNPESVANGIANFIHLKDQFNNVMNLDA